MQLPQTVGADKPVPPIRFLETAQAIAQILGLDMGMIIDGHPMQFKEVTFWLQHYGQRDPSGIVVMVEAGTVPSDNLAQFCRQSLEQQFLDPVQTDGYFCLLPGTEIIVHGLRIDFDKTLNAAEVILDHVEKMAAQSELAAAASANEGEHSIQYNTVPRPINTADGVHPHFFRARICQHR